MRELTPDQRQARRERAKARRERARKEGTTTKKSKPKKRKQAKGVKPKGRAKRAPGVLREGVTWKCEMVTPREKVRYGPLWVHARRMGGKAGRWVAEEVARDVAKATGLKFKEVGAND